jgi:hypothetical protein
MFIVTTSRATAMMLMRAPQYLAPNPCGDSVRGFCGTRGQRVDHDVRGARVGL